MVFFFIVSVCWATKHEKSSNNSGKVRRKIREKFRDENSKNSGNFCSATFWPGPSAEMCRGFLLYKFWRIFPGIFLEDFSGHFFTRK